MLPADGLPALLPRGHVQNGHALPVVRISPYGGVYDTLARHWRAAENREVHPPRSARLELRAQVRLRP